MCLFILCVVFPKAAKSAKVPKVKKVKALKAEAPKATSVFGAVGMFFFFVHRGCAIIAAVFNLYINNCIIICASSVHL